jgi:PAS domain S-box-containing protein
MTRSRTHRLLGGLLLGLAALWLNGFALPLLTPETRPFAFGKTLVLVAFAWLGPLPGLLAAALSVSELAARGATGACDAVVTLVETSAAYFVWRRTGSLAFGVMAFWLTLGWGVDLLLHGGVAGLDADTLALLYVNQLFEGISNALAAEVALGAVRRFPAGLRGLLEPAAPLRAYLFRHAAFVVLLPSVVLGLIHTRAAYLDRLERAASRQRLSGEAAANALERWLREVEDDLRVLAREVERDWARHGPGPSERLEAFLRTRPDVSSVGLADERGEIVDSRPRVNARGGSSAPGNIAGQAHFEQARNGLRGARAPLVRGAGQAPQPDEPDPVLALGEPLLSRELGALGVLYATLGGEPLVRLLREHRLQDSHWPTLLDEDGRVVASLAPGRSPGQRAGGGLHGAGSPFAALGRLEALGWTLAVETPGSLPGAELRPLAVRTLVYFLAPIGLLGLLLLRVASVVSQPLASLSRAAEAVGRGREPEATDLEALAASPLAEVRGLANRFAWMRDVLAWKEADAAEALRESERRYAALFEEVPIGVMVFDAGGRLVQANPASLQILGRARTQVAAAFAAGETWDVVREDATPMPPEEHPLLRTLRTGQAVGEVLMGVGRPDGRRAWILAAAEPRRDADGAVREAICTFTDVTHRRESEEALRRTADQLRQSQKMEAIGTLAGGIAHDFNNLLNVIQGYATLLINKMAEDDPARRRVEQILRASDRAADLTRQLLAFSRRQILQPQVLALGSVVAETDPLLHRLLGEDVELTSRVAPGLWKVKADRGQIVQVLMNLAANAREAMPTGGMLALRLENAEVDEPAARQRPPMAPGAYVRLTISDTGPGMPAEVRAHVFEPFFTTKAQGTGLGLSTVYGIVKQSGGWIWLDSQPGSGATFDIYLPRADEPLPAPPPAAARTAAAAGGETVLLVEDQEMLREVVREGLTGAGYSVLSAADGPAALREAEAHSGAIDILLTDVVMPRMSGRELASRLTRLRTGLRVVYMSGYTDDAVARHGLDPSVPFLHKPFSQETLLAKLREVLDAEAPGRL